MICENCGRPLTENDKVSEIDIDLSISERWDFVACEQCTKNIVKKFVGEPNQI